MENNRCIRISYLFIALFLVFLVGCTSVQDSVPIGQGTVQGSDAGQGEVDWKEIDLKDVITGETFKISDFKGKPIFVETMAVWCPLCTRQQIQIQIMANELGDSVVHVSIDTDLNENEAKLKDYAARQGFDWPFVIDPQGRVGKQLVDKFGFNAVNPPSTPVIFIDENFNERILRFGIKSSDELIAELGK